MAWTGLPERQQRRINTTPLLGAFSTRMQSADAQARIKVMPLPNTQESASQAIRDASSVIALKLLRELLDYDQRLHRLSREGQNSYLIPAYRKELRQRSRMLETLPSAPEQFQTPWKH